MKSNPKIFSQIIPAGPGYYALDLVGSPRDGSFRIQKQPVLAWFIAAECEDGPDTFVTAVCQEALSDVWDGAILRPDGKVVIRGVRQWDSFEEYEKYALAERHNIATAIARKHHENEEALNNAGVRHDCHR